MPQHPAPATIVAHLRRVADALERPMRRCSHRGDCTPACRRPVAAADLATEMAALLAIRGYPSSTLGTGIAGGGDETTSTERAALDPGPWAGIDDRLGRELRALWAASAAVENTLARVLAHADDADPLPAGRGHCVACERLCLGDGNDRLRAGLCHACTEAWRRWRQGHPLGQRSDFVRDRRAQRGVAADGATHDVLVVAGGAVAGSRA